MKQQILRAAARLGAVSILVALFASCTGYDQRWAAAPAPTRHDPFAGRWEGRWNSTKRRGEGDALRCVFTPVGGGRYEAAFHAHWKIFASDYTAIFETKRHGDRLDFQGEHQMPAIFGGVYRFSGNVTPVKFSATYHSSYDDGTFDLARENSGKAAPSGAGR